MDLSALTSGDRITTTPHAAAALRRLRGIITVEAFYTPIRAEVPWISLTAGRELFPYRQITCEAATIWWSVQAKRGAMPEEIEVPTEHLHEALEHEAHKAHCHETADSAAGWIPLAALSSAILAVFAAISALLAGHYANEAMLEQIRASDGWAYFQAKGIKAAVLQSKVDLLTALGKEASDGDRAKIEEYRKEQEEIKADAEKDVQLSKHHLQLHQILARTVTLFQIAIAMAAISVLSRKKRLWHLSLLLGVAGAALLTQSLL